MHKVSHWSIPYFYRYVKSFIYFKANRNQPWLTKETNNLLDCWLKEDDIGFEWGSGSSTLWFAKRVKRITSIEHNPGWNELVKSKIKHNTLEKKAALYLILEEMIEPEKQAYVQKITTIPHNSLDFCLVDGIFRDHCALASLPAIKNGGLLIIDDIQRYFPDTINTNAPYARKKDDGYLTETWEKVGKKISNWRQIRLSNGIKDTGIFFKP